MHCGAGGRPEAYPFQFGVQPVGKGLSRAVVAVESLRVLERAVHGFQWEMIGVRWGRCRRLCTAGHVLRRDEPLSDRCGSTQHTHAELPTERPFSPRAPNGGV